MLSPPQRVVREVIVEFEGHRVGANTPAEA